ncbi:MAG TPA: pentapeptide repeat-containing protein [Blastocatellia bacterium]|nr:pentapeptide repeat-containing protein [Blastocatellia bacterium]
MSRHHFCIFHSPKLSEEKKQRTVSKGSETREKILQGIEQREEEFRQKVLELLRQGEADPNTASLDLRGFSFPSVDLRSTVFHKPVSFREAHFVQQPRLNAIVFKQATDFCKVKFDTTANFFGVRFEQDADFSGATFNGDPNFYEAVFEKEAKFLGATFEESATFLKCQFKGMANFGFASFNKGCLFLEAIFTGKVSFSCSAFQNGANFSTATFNGETSFYNTPIVGLADFSKTTFEGDISFINTHFLGIANFSLSSFQGNVYFVSALFGDEAYFVGDRSTKCFKRENDFRRVALGKDAALVFDKVDLGMTRLQDTDLERVGFRDVFWHRPKTWLRRKRALWDEFRPLEQDTENEPQYERTAENYRQLVLNYEKKRDYDSAEDFHIGEMEMRRKLTAAGIRSLWLRRAREWVNAHAIYKLLSNYGTSYVQAFSALVLLLIGFAFAFFLTGFRPTSDNQGGKFGIVEALLLSLSVITFQRERFYEPVGWQSRLCLYLAVFMLTAQIALLLLAIRRRFRR